MQNILNLNRFIGLLSLVTLFLFATFFFQYNMGKEGLFIPRNIIAWLIVSLFISFTFFKLISLRHITLPKYYLGLLALPIAIFLSSFIAGVELPVNWLFRVLFILGGLFFLFCLFQYDFKEKDIKHLLTIITISVLLNAILGVLQVHFPELILNIAPSADNGRPVGMFQQVNANASYSATGLLISFYLLSRVTKSANFHWSTVVYILTIGAVAYTIMLSSSRVGVLSVAVGVALIMVGRWPLFSKKKALISVALLAFISGTYFGISEEEILTEKVGKTLDPYSSARLGIYGASLELIKQKPFFGHGIGSFDNVFTEQRGHYLIASPKSGLSQLPFINHPHNEFLFWMIEGGLITFIGIISTFLIIVFSLFALGKSRALTYSALLLPISLHTQVELPFYISAIHWFLFLLLVFIVLRHNTFQYKLALSGLFGLTIKTMAILMAIISCLFLINSLKVNQDIVRYNNAKTGDVHMLMAATKNIYFSQYAERTIMVMSAKSGILLEDTQKIDIFSEWAEEYLKKHPDYIIQEILVRSYRYLGKFEHMCITLNKGVFLYPRNNKLLKLKQDLKCN